MLEKSLHCTLPGYTVIDIPASEKKLHSEYEKEDVLVDILTSWGVSSSTPKSPANPTVEYKSYKLLRKLSVITLLLFMVLAFTFLVYFSDGPTQESQELIETESSLRESLISSFRGSENVASFYE